MKIAIQERLSPYIHALHARCLLPGTNAIIEVEFPLVRIGDAAITLPLADPVRNLTLQQDLRRGRVYVFAKHFHLTIQAKDGFIDTVLRTQGCAPSQQKFPYDHPPRPMQLQESLSLGRHKAQNAAHILHRLDLREILPMIYALSQHIPPSASPLQLFTTQNLDAWKTLFQKGFSSLFVPNQTSHEILPGLFHTIRAWFIKEDSECITLLAFCPFASGRLTHFASRFGTIDLEWRKHKPRILILHANTKADIRLDPGASVSFRLRNDLASKGERHHAGSSFPIEPGCVYFLDRFCV